MSIGEDWKGASLILLHGIADSLHSFDLVVPHLPKAGYGTKNFEQDLLMFMDALQIGRAVVLGRPAVGS
ncbi:alpha/beta fold hydrolase [Anaerotalea alkaliphila]|uniref:Alpha/beta hydrolase n=1 Tax=Anaerotalea alkaliphila TaxID=2662126 RepID=A0A7X5KPA8_9FIRM|nr:alpha/beta hydrolase [Anaerotalea alkaliphila]NDL67802.1 alpha/beta hydrolase [Anaerotalea alkaliphila]